MIQNNILTEDSQMDVNQITKNRQAIPQFDTLQ